MRKSLLLCGIGMLCSGAVFAQSQIDRGRIMAGGSAGFDFSKDKAKTGTATVEVKNRYYYGDLKAGLFLMDGFALGAAVDLNSLKESPAGTTAADVSTTTNWTTVGPFARFYSKSNVFGEMQLGFGSGKITRENNPKDDITRNRVFSWSAGVGYAFFLKGNLAIEPLVKYYRVSETDKQYESNNLKRSGVNLNIGLQVFF